MFKYIENRKLSETIEYIMPDKDLTTGLRMI